jgi:hypothetical protein
MKLIKYVCQDCYDVGIFSKEKDYTPFTFYLHQQNDWDDLPFCPNCKSDYYTKNLGEIDAKEL